MAYKVNAVALLNGVLPEGRDIWYLSYCSFLAAISFLGGDQVVVLFQVIISGIALYFLYHATNRITSSEITAVLTCAFYIGWIKIHEWNFFIYTESLFTSMSIISFAALILSSTKKQCALAWLIFIFTFFIRPAGIALLTGVMVYGLAHFYHQVRRKVWIATLVILVSIGLWMLNSVIKDFGLIDSYQKAELIYPNINLGLQPPAELILPSDEQGPLMKLISFAFHNPLYFFKITGLKFLLFLGNVKPYFSLFHNAMIVVFLYPLYFFAITGFRHFTSNRKEHYFIAGFVIMQTATVSLTSENWDGRFLIPVLPFIFLLSAVGINHWRASL